MEDAFGGGLGFEVVEGRHVRRKGRREGEVVEGEREVDVAMSRCREETHVKLMEVDMRHSHVHPG